MPVGETWNQRDGDGVRPDFMDDIDVRRGFHDCFGAGMYAEQVYLGEVVPSYSQLPMIFGDAVYQTYMYGLDLDKVEQHFRAAFDGALWDTGFKLTLAYNIGNDMRRVSMEVLEANLEALAPLFDLDVVDLGWVRHSFLSCRAS